MWARYFRVAGLRSFWGIDLEWCSARGSIFWSFSASDGHALFKFVMWRLKSTGACHASAPMVAPSAMRGGWPEAPSRAAFTVFQ